MVKEKEEEKEKKRRRENLDERKSSLKVLVMSSSRGLFFPYEKKTMISNK